MQFRSRLRWWLQKPKFDNLNPHFNFTVEVILLLTFQVHSDKSPFDSEYYPVYERVYIWEMIITSWNIYFLFLEKWGKKKKKKIEEEKNFRLLTIKFISFSLWQQEMRDSGCNCLEICNMIFKNSSIYVFQMFIIYDFKKSFLKTVGVCSIKIWKLDQQSKTWVTSSSCKDSAELLRHKGRQHTKSKCYRST